MSQWGKWGKWGRWGEESGVGPAPLGIDLYWVGDADGDWFNPLNWATSSGGAGGAGYPGATNDVYIDREGGTFCTLQSAAVCKNFNFIEVGFPVQGVFDQNGQSLTCVNFYYDNDKGAGGIFNDTHFDGPILVTGTFEIAIADYDDFYDEGAVITFPNTVTIISSIDLPTMYHQDDVTYPVATVERLMLDSGVTVTMPAGTIFALNTYTAGDWDGAILVSSTPSTAWTLNNFGLTMVVSDMTVTDSNANAVVDATDNCVDGGGNTNWTFPPVQQWPVVHNWEGDTVLDDVATLDAKDTHYETGAAGALLQLDDHLLWNPQNIGGPPNLTLGLENPGNVSAWSKILFAAGEGFTPQDNQEMCIETVNIVNGSNNRHIMYIQSEDNQEGFRLEMYGNSFNYLRTMTGGVWDAAWKLGPYGLSRNPTADRWWYWGVRYNFANNQVRCRVLPLSTGSGQTDTGWVLIGTVSGPSFDPTVELREVFCIAGGGTVAPCGQGQIYVSDFAVDGSSDGAIMTHNYVVPA